ncbi:hypothetical protein M3Y96_00027600 [Aphelenchoides besseyi]|nr:hypothetical protein M3Y96_00027600 [Aphelenchoides besseyi]
MYANEEHHSNDSRNSYYSPSDNRKRAHDSSIDDEDVTPKRKVPTANGAFNMCNPHMYNAFQPNAQSTPQNLGYCQPSVPLMPTIPPGFFELKTTRSKAAFTRILHHRRHSTVFFFRAKNKGSNKQLNDELEEKGIEISKNRRVTLKQGAFTGLCEQEAMKLAEDFQGALSDHLATKTFTKEVKKSVVDKSSPLHTQFLQLIDNVTQYRIEDRLGDAYDDLKEFMFGSVVELLERDRSLLEMGYGDPANFVNRKPLPPDLQHQLYALNLVGYAQYDGQSSISRRFGATESNSWVAIVGDEKRSSKFNYASISLADVLDTVLSLVHARAFIDGGLRRHISA